MAVDQLDPMVRATDYSPALWNLTNLLYTAAAGDDPAAAANAYCALRRYPADPLSSVRRFPTVAYAAALADCRVAQLDLLFDVRLPDGPGDPAAAGGGSPVEAYTANGTAAAAFVGDKMVCFTVSDNQVTALRIPPAGPSPEAARLAFHTRTAPAPARWVWRLKGNLPGAPLACGASTAPAFKAYAQPGRAGGLGVGAGGVPGHGRDPGKPPLA